MKRESFFPQVELDAIQGEVRFYDCAFKLLRDSRPSAARTGRLINLRGRLAALKRRLAKLTHDK